MSLMAKGYWIVTTTVTNPEGFGDYVKGFAPWVESVGGRLFAKDLDSKTVEGKGGHLGVIVEFASKQLAIDAYEGEAYQKLSKLRWSNSTDTNITIIEGLA